jgi:hypothetical protein
VSPTVTSVTIFAPEPVVVVLPVATVVALEAAFGTVTSLNVNYVVVCVFIVAAPIVRTPLLTLTPLSQSVLVELEVPAPVAVV